MGIVTHGEGIRSQISGYDMELRISKAERASIRLVIMDIITTEQFRNLDKLIHTDDNENLLLAETLIKEYLKEM